MPTILDEINFETDGLKLDGKSLVPVIEGKEKKERVVVAYKAENVFGSHLPEKYAISSGRFKLILNKEMTEKDISFFTSIPPFRGEFELSSFMTFMPILLKKTMLQKKCRRLSVRCSKKWSSFMQKRRKEKCIK